MKSREIIITTLVAALIAACEIEPTSAPTPASPEVEETALEEVATLSEVELKERRKLVSKAGDRSMAAAFHAAPQFQGLRPPSEPLDRENYHHVGDNPVKRVVEQPVSTFSIDVDTGAYANIRRMLHEGRLPPKDAVRVEELINYFSYDDPGPENGDTPFRVNLELGPNPWNARTRLLRIAIKAWRAERAELPPANLVFLVDVSGSMQSANKLPLLKRSLKLLVRELDQNDRVTLVVYAGASGVVLEPTPGDQSARIEQALERLRAGGSTNGGAGIRLAYAKAREAFIEAGVNRVILATDGDFNVGTVNHQALIDLVEQQRKAGIALTTLGFGGGNYNDHLMEQLADHGDGNYAYIDTLLEARKVLVEEMGGTLQTLAKDVKVQIEFNPARVSEYRLIGYENRRLNREDFNNDRVDAGEVGAGHSVVALYEIALQGEGGERIDPLRYGSALPTWPGVGDELAFVKLRYKEPGAETSKLLAYPVRLSHARDKLAATSRDYRFCAAVAAFGQRLRGGQYLDAWGYDDILELAREGRGEDRLGYRGEFLQLVGLAQSLR